MSSVQVFTDRVILPARREDVFAYYATIEALTLMVLPSLHFKVVRADTPLRLGSRAEFEVGPKNIPLAVPWISEITAFDPPSVFEDRMVKGPFHHWVHRHEFIALNDHETEIMDRLEFGNPKGFVGQAVSSLLVGSRIEQLFAHRRQVLEEKFGTVE